MLQRLVTVGIVVFWLVMVGLLVKREVIPSLMEQRAAIRGTRYETLLQRVRRKEKVHMGVYFAGRRLGRMTTTFLPGADETFRIRTVTELAPRELPFVLKRFEGSVINFETRVGPNHRLVGFALDVRLAATREPLLKMTGRLVADELVIRTSFGDTTSSRRVPFDSRLVLSGGLTPILHSPEIHVGKQWMVRVVNPLTQRVETMWAEVVRKQPSELEEVEEVYVVQVKARGKTWETWVDDAGRIVKQKTPFGLEFVLEPAPPRQANDEFLNPDSKREGREPGIGH